MAPKKRKRKKRPAGDAPQRRRVRIKLSRLQAGLFVLFALAVLLFYFRASFFANWANAAIGQRDLDRAKKHLATGTTFARSNGRLQFLLARVARLEGRMKDVREHLKKANDDEFDPVRLEREQYLAMAQMGQIKESQQYLAEMLTDPRGDEEEICEAYVIGYTKIRHFAAAKDLLDKWMQDFPQSARPRYLKGIVQKDLQMWNEAAKAFREALSVDPQHHDSAFELGSVLLTRKRPEEALEYFQFASRGKAHAVDSQVAQAHCMRLLDRHEEAHELLDGVLEKQPQHEDASLELARIQLDTNNYPAVVALLEPLVAKNDRNTDMRLVLAQALRGMGRLAEAESHITAVAKINAELVRANEMAQKVGLESKSADARCEIAKIYLQYGSREEGLMWLMGAFQVNPKHKPTLESLVDYYGENGDADNMQMFLRHLEQLK